MSTLLHVFDHTIKPVLLYGSEIWCYFTPQKLTTKPDQYFFNLCKTISIEKVHIKFCKYALGLRQNTANLAVLGELGRYPLTLVILYNMIKYWIRLTNIKDSLLSSAFGASKALFEDGKDSWVGCMNSICKYFDINTDQILRLKSKLKVYIYNKLKLKYNHLWHQELNDDREGRGHGNKLRTYRSFKHNIKFEKHLLSCKNIKILIS